MSTPSSTPTRISSDVVAAATEVGSSEHRSAAEQINHWARIGMQVERSSTLANRRVLAVAAGRAQFSELHPDERVAAHALIDAAIAERVASARFGESARAEGQRTVSLDEQGNLIEIAADGTITAL
jgi:deoxyxylulose-5-phosphate synthase